MPVIHIIQGPNLNLLGSREPAFYGTETLEKLHNDLVACGRDLDLMVECFQSNHEGELVELIHQAAQKADYLIINAAAYTHTSVAIRDALKASGIEAIEVHISNIHKREEFRHKSLLADVVRGQIIGLGVYGYHLALRAAAFYLEQGGKNS